MNNMRLSILDQVRRAGLRTGAVLLVLVLVLACGVAYAFLVEPHWLVVRQVRIAEKPTLRLIHITDIHYRGDRDYLNRLVDRINRTPADLVCFTGDLVEGRGLMRECLDILGRLNKPLLGVPGNHDLWIRLPADKLRAGFARTGGTWLTDTNLLMLGGRLEVAACSSDSSRLPSSRLNPAAKRILLTHYPRVADEIRGQSFDLILAGHSHGGQVRIPIIGSLVLPFNVRPYDAGLFHTPAGPLHVNPGIGYFYLDVRFGRRPEITVLEL